MTPMQTLLIEQSELREGVNAILGKTEDQRTEEERATLVSATERLRAMEPDLRAAVAADETDQTRLRGEFAGDAAGAELRALIAGSSIAAVFTAAVEHRQTDGRVAELQQHFNVGSNQIPLALLREPVEERATGVTPAPSNVGINQSEIIPAVFPASAAAFMSVDQPTVGVGEAIFPVLSTSADAGVPAENASQDETAGGFTAELLAPSRIQASFFFSREDRARFAGMDAALRQNLSDSLSDKLDQQVVNGTNGLLNGTVLPNHNRTTIADFAYYKSDFAYARVDGKWASTTGDLRILMGSSCYAHAATTYRAAAGASDSIDAALAVLMSATAGVRVSSHVPALDNNNRQNSVIRLGARRDMVNPLWQGVTILVDEITKAQTGQVVLTAIMLHAVKVLRADGFYKVGTQTA